MILSLFFACGSENQIIDPNHDCASGEVQVAPITYELTCPEIPACPDVHLSCPEVTIPECPPVNVVCPEPVVTVEAPSVTIEPASVTVDVEFSDLVDAIEDLALSSSGSGTNSTWSHVGYTYVDYLWTNNTSTYAVLTTAVAPGGCNVYDASGNIQITALCNSGRCLTDRWSPGVLGAFMVPIEPGGWIDCSGSNYGGLYLGGYYQ